MVHRNINKVKNEQKNCEMALVLSYVRVGIFMILNVSPFRSILPNKLKQGKEGVFVICSVILPDEGNAFLHDHSYKDGPWC